MDKLDGICYNLVVQDSRFRCLPIYIIIETFANQSLQGVNEVGFLILTDLMMDWILETTFKEINYVSNYA